MQNISEFKQLISTPKKAVIIPHQKPDADALGSSLGLGNYLKKKQHEVCVISPTDYPEFLSWMEGNDDVLNFEKQEKLGRQKIEEADLVFCMDFNNLKRIDNLGLLVENSKAVKILIDHHLEPDNFADFSFWDLQAAATAEIVFDLIEALGDRNMIDAGIAEALYAGIMTDTGSFHHSNTTHKVHQVVSELMDLGANVTRVAKLIYDNYSVERLKFIGFALSERLTVIPELRTAYFSISADDLKKYHSQTGDTEGLVNYGLSIKGIILSAAIIERPDVIKFSFRSVGDFSVNDLARKYFEGGGHKNAAGGRMVSTLNEAAKKFEEVIYNYKENLNPEFHKTHE